MKIYREGTTEELQQPDLSAGFVYDGQRVTGRTEEHLEVMEGTVTEDRPGGLRRLVPAQDITEACQYYHPYTEEELAARAAAEQPSQLDRVDAQATYTAMMTDTLLDTPAVYGIREETPTASMAEKIRKWFAQGLWGAPQVAQAVEKGVLTQAQYEEIVGDG